MYNRPYRGYKRSRNRLIRLTLLIFIVFVILIGALGFLFVQNYLVFSSTGVKVALPFSQADKTAPETAKDPDLEIVKPDVSNASQTPAASSDNTQSAAPGAITSLKAVSIPVEKLSDSTYLAKLVALHQKGVLNSVVVEIKTSSGKLNYTTALPAAKDASVSTNAATYFTNGINTLKSGGLQLIGEISCFNDNTMTHIHKDMAVKTKKGLTWLDYNSKRHLDPYNDSAAQYLSGIVKECSNMGFSEVILTDFVFPAKGQLKLISYGNQTLSKSEILAKRLTEFGQTAGAMKVSVYVSQPTAAGGKNETTGMDITSLAQSAYRLYAPVEGQSPDSETAMVTAMSAFTGGDKAKIVPVLSRADAISKAVAQPDATANYLFDITSSNYSLDNFGS